MLVIILINKNTYFSIKSYNVHDNNIREVSEDLLSKHFNRYSTIYMFQTFVIPNNCHSELFLLYFLTYIFYYLI